MAGNFGKQIVNARVSLPVELNLTAQLIRMA
jgi:hypothetical protein